MNGYYPLKMQGDQYGEEKYVYLKKGNSCSFIFLV